MVDSVIACILLHLPQDVARVVEEYSRLTDVEKMHKWLSGGTEIRSMHFVRQVNVPDTEKPSKFKDAIRPIDIYYGGDDQVLQWWAAMGIRSPNPSIYTVSNGCYSQPVDIQAFTDFATGKRAQHEVFGCFGFGTGFSSEDFRAQLAAILA